MLIVTVINATPVEISVLSALGVVPYLFLGLIIGAVMDQWRRQRTLVITSIGRALALVAVPLPILLNARNYRTLAAVVLALGALTLFTGSARVPGRRPAGRHIGHDVAVSASAGWSVSSRALPRPATPRIGREPQRVRVT